MSIESLIRQLEQQQIRLSLDDQGDLLLRANKGILTPALQDDIRQHKAALIAWLKQQESSLDKRYTQIPHTEHKILKPLSLQQQRLWLTCQSIAGNAAYQIPLAIRIKGPLQPERLARAIERVIAAHAILRCSIREVLGKPVHVESTLPALEIIDFESSTHDSVRFSENDSSNDNASDGSTGNPAINAYTSTWLAENLDPENGPLLRVQLLRLATPHQDEFLLLLNIHHLITDGWSNRLLLQQIIEHYTRDETNKPDTTAPDFTVDYFDYAAWQQQQWQDGKLAPQLDDWKQHLANMEALSLPTKTPQLPGPVAATSAHTLIDIAPATLKALKNRSQEQHISTFALYLAAYQLALYKLTHTPVFGILSPFANRQHNEVMQTIGFFVNTLPLKADFSQNLTMQALAQQSHQTVQQANSVSEVPFDAIAESLTLHNANEVARFFQAAISHETDTLFEQTEIDGIHFESLPWVSGAPKFPLLLNISERHATKVWLEYNTGIFDNEFIQRLGIYFRRALHAVVFNPHQTVNTFSLLTENEQLSVLGIDDHRSQYAFINRIGDSNRTDTALPAVNALHELFTRQAEITPHAIAVSDDSTTLTYAELDRQSSQLAHYLCSRYKPLPAQQNIIGLCMERSVNVSIALLGILKSGNAYLPIDAQLPQERMAFMLNDSKPACIITTNQFRNLFKDATPCLLIENPGLWQQAAAGIFSNDTDKGNTKDSSLFNLIYTSGSTGQPKGVRVLQHGIINRLLWMQAQYPLDNSDVILQKTPLSFDVSVWELFWPLLNGARLHFAKADGHRDAMYLCDVIRAQGITTLHFVPSMLDFFLDAFVDTPLVDAAVSLKRVLCSGEALLGNHVSRFREVFHDVALHNLYGPTECSVDVSFYDCLALAESELTAIPTGKPIWNTRLHILDHSLRPVVPGCIGEIYIGGIGLAEGYHHNETLTAERFIDNPFYLDGHPSPRLYKTGDLGRHLTDGNIEFLGRNDLQVKLRGLRIELGDIEHHALQQAGVRQAAAAVTHEQGNQQLLLFYNASETINTSQWREFLQQHLPDYMLPNGYIPIHEWPFTASGKTDRKALLALHFPASNANDAYIKAENSSQQFTQQVWEQHFHMPVSVDASFFDIGGHSLLAMRIIAVLAEHFQVNLQFRDIFTHNTIASLAGYIDTLPRINDNAITVATTAETYPASFQQQRLYLFQALYPQSTTYNMPASFEINGKPDISALQHSLHYLIKRHTVLHTLYGSGPDHVFQKPLKHYEWQLAFSDFSRSHRDIQRLAREHGQQVFDLHTDLPLKAALYKLADNHYLFCFCLHHIAGDALSLEIIARELSLAYSAFSQHQKPALPDLALQYRDFACWQRQQDMDKQLRYWQNTLTDAPELLALPHDNPRPLQQSYHGAQYHEELDSRLVKDLYDFSREQQLTPFMVLLSTLQVLLGKLAQQDDVCVGVPTAGRHRNEIQSLVGFFVNSVIMRSRQHDNPGFGDFLQHQKNTILEAFAHQDIPVEKVLEQLALDRAPGHSILRTASHNPVAQIGFNFLQDNGTEQLALSFPHLQITPLQVEAESSKYEMTWIFYRHASGIRLVIEYNTDLFFADTLRQWAGYFSTLLRQAITTPQTSLQQLQCVSETEIRHILQQRYEPIARFYPLTATQRDIYLDSLFFPHKRHNQLGFMTHSTTPLDMPLWGEVLADLYNHADSLRARIISTHHPLLDVAWQVIPPAGDLPTACFSFINHGDASLTDQEKHRASETALFSPWLETDPLWRVHIHEYAGKNYLFILAAHHAMFDGASIQMLGRMIKGNYQHRLEGHAPDYPANNYAEHVEQRRLHSDSSAIYHFWQNQADSLQPYLDLRPLLHEQPDRFSSIEYPLAQQEWQQLQQLCREWRTTPPLFFKAVFALAIKSWHHMQGNFCFTEVVLGRDKDFYTTQGLFFEQQPNIIAASDCTPEHTLQHFLAALRQYRKQIAPFTPVSLHLQQRLLPATVPYLFNFYIMESATPFLGHMERIEHLMPEMDHAVNCIVKVIGEQLHIQLMHNPRELQGEAFLNAMADIIHHCLQGRTLIGELLPAVPEWKATRFSPALPLSATPMSRMLAPLRKTEQRLPANALEQQLLTIWQEVLGRQDIAVDDNFFELGGHSLHAMRIASRLRDQFTFDIPLDAIFQQPTVAAIALHLQESATHLHNSKLPAITRSTTRDVYPLSPAQQRLWFLTQLNAANQAYNIPVALQLDGTLDKAALLQAVQALLERQQVLRSVIDHPGDNRIALPQWRIVPADSIAVTEVTITATIESTIDSARADNPQTLLHMINSEGALAFDVNHEALVRLKLITLSHTRHILLLTLHHLIADAASLAIIARELGVLYQSFHHRQPNPLPALAIQYADYAWWQKELLNSERVQQQLDYWRTELDQAPELLGLPIDRPRPPLQTFNGAQLAFTLPVHLTEKLKSIARAQGLTPFMLLLGSYQLLLSKTCRQRDVCVGIPRDGRVMRELEPLAGFFINALVIRTRLDANYSIKELLGKVRDKTLQAFANDIVPAEQVMQALHLKRQLQFTPIVQAAFNYLTTPDSLPSTQLEGLHISIIQPAITSAKFELLLTATDTTEGMTACLEYNSDLFDADTIANVRDHWLYLLGLIADNPEARIDQLHLPGSSQHDAQHDDIVCLSAPPMPALEPIPQQVSLQAHVNPDAIAVICGNEKLSYSALEMQSNVIAQQLMTLGVAVGDRVGICMGRRAGLLPAILGAIKAGACYVPMDRNYPVERLAYMLEDSAARVLITESRMWSHMPVTNAVIMDIDTLDLSVVVPAPCVTIGMDDLLYMIYTSGSTGLPKGAAVYHRSEANLLAWYTKEFGLSSNDTTLVISAIGFDLTQKNLLALLTVGGTIVLPDIEHYDVDTLLRCIDENNITVMNCAPSAFYPLVELGGTKAIEQLQSLRTVLLGGEPIYLQRLNTWITSPAFNCSIVNMYGPTECTDISAFHTLSAQQLKPLITRGKDSEFPLGKPAAGISLYLLNEQLQSVPNGLVGELCIAGISVGAGYWNKPELTARAFMPNPFTTGEHDKILYRSGDLARLNPDDGLLYYIGRKDFQLKLRGLRIESGEIEHALRSLPAVKDAIVQVDNDQLLAFVLTDSTDNIASAHNRSESWRDILSGHLPDYMIPSILIAMTEWPLTPNGKIDRAALLSLERPDNATQYVAPRTDLEKDIAQLWQEVLGITQAGVFDNFFTSGGDSLAAIRFIAGLEARFNIILPVSSLFGAQTIAQIAQVISNRMATWSPIVPIQTQGHKTPIFALHALGAMVLSYEPLARALGKDRPFYGIQAYGFEDGQIPYSHLDEMLDFYVTAIRQQQTHGPYQIIGHSFGGILAIEIARKLQQQGETVQFVGLLDTHLPISYAGMTIDDSIILKAIHEQFHGLITEDFSRRAIAVVRGFQAMMTGFKMQPLDNIPLLLFTPQDWSAKLQGFALNISQLRNIKTRGFEKISKNVKVITVPGDHYSMLKVDAQDLLTTTLLDIIQ